MAEDLLSTKLRLVRDRIMEAIERDNFRKFPICESTATIALSADKLDRLEAEIERLQAREKALVGALEECADSLEAEIKATYPGRDDYPIQSRRYERDMAPVNKARALTAARQQEPSHG